MYAEQELQQLVMLARSAGAELEITHGGGRVLDFNGAGEIWYPRYWAASHERNVRL